MILTWSSDRIEEHKAIGLYRFVSVNIIECGLFGVYLANARISKKKKKMFLKCAQLSLGNGSTIAWTIHGQWKSKVASGDVRSRYPAAKSLELRARGAGRSMKKPLRTYAQQPNLDNARARKGAPRGPGGPEISIVRNTFPLASALARASRARERHYQLGKYQSTKASVLGHGAVVHPLLSYRNHWRLETASSNSRAFRCSGFGVGDLACGATTTSRSSNSSSPAKSLKVRNVRSAPRSTLARLFPVLRRLRPLLQLHTHLLGPLLACLPPPTHTLTTHPPTRHPPHATSPRAGELRRLADGAVAYTGWGGGPRLSGKSLTFAVVLADAKAA
jgi:hypothetical protein